MALSGDIALGYWYVIGKMVGAPWDGVPLIINPICTLYNGYLLGISTFKGLQQGGLKQPGVPIPIGPPPFLPTLQIK